MKQSKKPLHTFFILLSCALFSLATSAQAKEQYSPMHYDNSMHPFFNLSLLFAQPTDAQLNYVIVVPDDSLDLPQNGVYRNVEPNHAFDFDAAAGVYFKNSKTDITLHYKHFHDSKDDSVTPPEGGEIFSVVGHPDWSFGTTNIENPTLGASGYVKYELNNVVLELGHAMLASRLMKLRWSLGLNYLDLKRKFVVDYYGVEDDEDNARITSTSKFDGLGIAGGVDSHFALAPQFDLFGNFKTAFIVGTIKVKNVGTNDGADPLSQYDVKSKSDTVVSNLNLRVGLAYHCRWSHVERFTVKLGYQADKYFNAIGEQVFLGQEVALGQGYDGRSFHQYNNVSFNGPFLNIGIQL